MKNDFELRRCRDCGAMVEIIADCKCENCGIKCCGKTMEKVNANSVDASAEKHLPTYEVIGSYVVVGVNHVMEDDHYIEYIALDCDKINGKKYFNAGENPKAVFPYIPGSRLYGYCNKHGLWMCEVK